MAEETEQESEGESQIIRGDNVPIVDLKAYNTEGKEAQLIQINQVIEKVTGNQKNTEETIKIKKAEFNFMLDLKTLIAKSSTDAELNRVRDAMRRDDKDTAPEPYRTNFDKLNNKWGLTFNDDRIVVPTELRKKLLDTLHFGHAGANKLTAEAKIFWWPNMQKEIEDKTKNCVACMSSGKNLKNQLPKHEFGKVKTLTEPGQEIQIDFSGKLNNKKLNGDHQILIAIDRFSKWPTAKIWESSETKEVIIFLKQNFILYRLPEKIKTDKGGAFVSKEYKEFCKSKNIEIEYSTPKLHTGTGAVERAIQTLKNLIIANLEDETCLTECVNKALNVMRFTIHTGLKITPFELHHGRKPRTELTNIIKDGKTFLSKWSELTVSANNRPKIPIYVTRNGEGEVSNHLIMARTKTEEKAMTEKSPKKKNSVGKYPFQFIEKNHNRKSLEGRFQRKLQTAVSGTEHTVTTDTEKVIHRKFFSEPIIFQRDKRTAPKIGDTITPKNRHCLRGVDGKYIQWNEILRDVLNGKLKLVQNQRNESESESEEGEIEDEESDFENHDTSEKDGRYKPVTTSPEDELNLHTDGEINAGENQTNNKTTENKKIRRSNRESRQPNRYGGGHLYKNFWV